MAGLIFSPESRGQFEAIVRVRWQLVANSMRTLRGRFEIIARILAALMFFAFGVGGAIFLALVAYHFASTGEAEWMAGLLWPAFLWWQLFPVLGSAFTEVLDASNLLRFPLSYPSYFLIRLAYGSVDPYTVVVILWLIGIWIGVFAASPLLSLWAALALLIFAVLNILLGRAVFAWIERWLAQRRTREIAGLIFFLIIISFQFIGPVISHFGDNKKVKRELSNTINRVLPIERAMPPGLAALSIAQASHGQYVLAVRDLVLLVAYPLIFFWLLNMRLRAQYLGESLSESAARQKQSVVSRSLAPGWIVPGVSAPIGAIFEKEIRYLLRSGPMLFTIVMPSVILLIFRLTPAAPDRGGHFLAHTPGMAFPIGAAYSVLMLSNLVFNNFGPDQAGVQLYFAAPVRLRDVLLAKNLVHSAIAAFEMVVVWFGVCFLFGCPPFDIAMATLAGILFALPVNLAVGNLLSIYAPRKIDLGTFGRQRSTSSAQFAALGCQVVVLGLAAAVFLMARAYGAVWLASVAFLVLAVVAISVYWVLLARTERLALERREVLIAELSRA